MGNNIIPSESTRLLLSATRGASLPKGVDDTRPLAIGETFRRLASSLIITQIGSDKIAEACGLEQFAAGTKNGTQNAALISQLALSALQNQTADDGSSYCIMGLDCKAAFQSVERNAVINAAHERLPELEGLVRCLYSSPSLIFLAPHIHTEEDPTVLYSVEGVHQGCSIGTICFCLGVAEPIKQIQTAIKSIDPLNSLLLFADDVGLQASTTSSALCLRATIFEFAKVNLQINPMKTEVYAPSDHTETLYAPCPYADGESALTTLQTLRAITPPTPHTSLFLPIPPTSADLLTRQQGEVTPICDLDPDEVTLTCVKVVREAWIKQDGLTLVGSPVGPSDYVAAHVWKKCQGAVKAAKAVLHHASADYSYSRQNAYQLLRMCVFPRLHYLAQVMPLLLPEKEEPGDTPLLRRDRATMARVRLLLHHTTLTLHGLSLRAIAGATNEYYPLH